MLYNTFFGTHIFNFMSSASDPILLKSEMKKSSIILPSAYHFQNARMNKLIMYSWESKDFFL